MRFKFCQGPGCENKLTGKQRQFCSDACRTRHNRHKGEDEITAFILKTTGNRGANNRITTEYDNKRLFEVKLKVKFLGTTPPGEWDMSLLGEYIRRRIAQIVLEVLKFEHPDWQIEVKVESNYNGRG